MEKQRAFWEGVQRGTKHRKRLSTKLLLYTVTTEAVFDSWFYAHQVTNRTLCERVFVVVVWRLGGGCVFKLPM